MPTAPAKAVGRPGPNSSRAPLSLRQETFCQYYLTQPSGSLASVLAGNLAKNAHFQASRMQTKANILRRFAELGHYRGIIYEKGVRALFAGA